MRSVLPVLALLAILALLLTGCGDKPSTAATKPPLQAQAAPAPPGQASSPITFASVADQAGIDFTLGHNGKTPLTILETSGGGCAFLDFDNDGWSDVLLVGPFNVGLYRNLGNGKFENVTGRSGLAKNRYWMGCAVGDYDGDGQPDIFLTGYRCFALYRNLGGGRFSDVTAQSGIEGLDWSLSAAFADFDGDGRIDLYVSQYLKFDKSTQQICEVGNVRSACGPEVYEPLSGKLFMNADGHRFRTVPWKDTGKTWGALASNLLGDGRPALYLSNDMMPGDLWAQQNGRWENIGPSSGTAYDAQGHMQGGMGVDSGDYNNDGLLDLFVTTYFAQAKSLYRNDGRGLFTVTSGPSGIGPPTTPYVGFGTGFQDLDNDGWLDIVIANGHVRDNVHDFDASQTYAQPIQVLQNREGRFIDVSKSSGDAANMKAVGRGLAYGDFNRDGRVDVLICDLEGKAILLENRSLVRHWLDVRLKGPGPNHYGLGAMVTLITNGKKQVREVRTCGSVMSAREPVAHFGLGDYAGSVQIQVRWPDGTQQNVQADRVDTTHTIEQKSAQRTVLSHW